MNKFLKKLTALALSAATALGAVSQSVLADTWVTNQNVVIYCEYYDYNYAFSDFGFSGGWYGQIPKLTADGQVAYCINSKQNSGYGNLYSNFTYTGTKSTSNDYSLALAYGYIGTTKYGYSADTERLATQIMIWCIEWNWYDGNDEETALNMYTAEMDNTLAADVKTVYYKIKANMQNFGTKPSFSGNSKSMTYDSTSGTWSVTLTDSNGVANQFDWSSAVSSYSYLSASATASTVTFTSTQEISSLKLTADYNNSYYTAVQAATLAPIAGEENEQEAVSFQYTSDLLTATVTLTAAEEETPEPEPAEPVDVTIKKTTEYGRNNFAAYLDNQINEHTNLIACNKEKADKMFQSLGLQLPPEETFINFNDSIAYTTENVKYPEQENYEVLENGSKILRDGNGKMTYREDSSGNWEKREYNKQGLITYYENSNGEWEKYEYDEQGREICYENESGYCEKQELKRNKIITK